VGVTTQGAEQANTAIDSGNSTVQVKHLNFRPAPQGTRTVAKPELGTKRLCANCSAKFYDLNKTPITCPKCHTVMELAAVAPRPRPEAARAATAAKEEALVPETQDAEFVSLEEADAESQGKKAPADADALAGDDDIELDDDEAMDDAALIEETEESDDDVTDIIGEREDSDEEP
jgi:uncharacterized protein (TIGR02300 family)